MTEMGELLLVGRQLAFTMLWCCYDSSSMNVSFTTHLVLSKCTLEIWRVV